MFREILVSFCLISLTGIYTSDTLFQDEKAKKQAFADRQNQLIRLQSNRTIERFTKQLASGKVVFENIDYFVGQWTAKHFIHKGYKVTLFGEAKTPMSELGPMGSSMNIRLIKIEP